MVPAGQLSAMFDVTAGGNGGVTQVFASLGASMAMANVTVN